MKKQKPFYEELQKGLTMKDVAKMVSTKELRNALSYQYPDWKVSDKYLKKFHLRIQNAKKTRKSKDSKGDTITFYAVNHLEVGEVVYHYGVHIKKDGDDTNWGMSFLPWDFLSTLPVAENNFKNFTMKDMLAHFTWEMTWYGDEEETKKKGKELEKAMKETASEIKKEVTKKE